MKNTWHSWRLFESEKTKINKTSNHSLRKAKAFSSKSQHHRHKRSSNAIAGLAQHETACAHEVSVHDTGAHASRPPRRQALRVPTDVHMVPAAQFLRSHRRKNCRTVVASTCVCSIMIDVNVCISIIRHVFVDTNVWVLEFYRLMKICLSFDLMALLSWRYSTKVMCQRIGQSNFIIVYITTTSTNITTFRKITRKVRKTPFFLKQLKGWSSGRRVVVGVVTWWSRPPPPTPAARPPARCRPVVANGNNKVPPRSYLLNCSIW